MSIKDEGKAGKIWIEGEIHFVFDLGFKVPYSGSDCWSPPVLGELCDILKVLVRPVSKVQPETLEPSYPLACTYRIDISSRYVGLPHAASNMEEISAFHSPHRGRV